MFPLLLMGQQQKERPRIGLTLSGGGAKGIAHIGLLMAIDSAGINVDYVSGTSMGAIVGGLYASGYSGKQIAELVRTMNWSRILTNRPGYDQLLLPYRENYHQFVEIPIVGKKLYFGTGLLESNELWLWLTNHFSPFNKDISFSDLPRSFRCVATRLDNGDVIVLEEGNLVEAIRASMAIPSVFTPVAMGENVLIDGGLVRNFPVSEVIDMGADLVIGSSVTDQQLSSEDLNTPLELITQIAFYSEKRDYRNQVKATDLYVDYPISEFHAGSFSSSEEILEIGIQRGKEMLPSLLRMKDSLDRLYGPEKFRSLEPVNLEKIHIQNIRVEDMDSTDYTDFLMRMDFRENRKYTVDQITEKIRNSFASGIFRKINYSFHENPDSTVNLNLSFERDYRTRARVGLGYNAETGLAIKLGLARHSLLSLFSSSSVGVSIGENPHFYAEQLLFLDKSKSFLAEASLKGGLTELNVFNENLAATGLFRQSHLRAEINLLKLINKDFLLGMGTRWENLRYKPEIQSPVRPKGKVKFLNSYLGLKWNNQDAPYNPHRGNKMDVEFGWIYNQNSKFTTDHKDDGVETLDFPDRDYFTFRYYSAHYLPVRRHTFYYKMNWGLHFGNKHPFVNDFLVGGNDFVIRNQILFPGFRLNGISTSSAFMGQMGMRVNFSSKFSLAAGPSILWYDFIGSNIKAPDQPKRTIGGLNLTAGYESIIGPIEVTLMHNTINNRVTTSFNLGYSMNFSN